MASKKEIDLRILELDVRILKLEKAIKQLTNIYIAQSMEETPKQRALSILNMFLLLAAGTFFFIMIVTMIVGC